MAENLLAVAVLHGMGRQRRGFSRPFAAALAERVRRRRPGRRLEFEELYWSDILAGRQDTLYRRLEAASRMDFSRLRHFVLDALADAVAYQPVPSEDLAAGELDVYAELHDRVAEGLERLAGRAGARAPLVLIAHSLGTVIASNYLWDCQKRRLRPAATSALARGRTLRDLVFLGSSLPLWSLRYRNLGQPIRFPVADPHGRWTHFYDPDDVLAWPVRPINAAYRRAVTEDRAVNVGGLLTAWNPLAHTAYWSDADVVDGVAELLAR